MFDSATAAYSGSVFIYQQDSDTGVWSLSTKLQAPTPSRNQNFGCSVDISGSNVLIGACGEDNASGNAYVYNVDTGLTQELGEFGGYFGTSVVIDGEQLAVGNQGAVRFFDLQTDGTWAITSTITCGSTCSSGERLGDQMAMSNGVAVLGVRSEPSWGYSGDGYTGAALVATYSSGTWTVDKVLIPTDGEVGDHFGNAVAIFKDFILVGAPYKDSSSSNTGKVYVYWKRGSEYILTDIITETSPSYSDRFGSAITVSEDGYAYIVGNHGRAAYLYQFPQ